MGKRPAILAGMAGGVFWGFMVLWWGSGLLAATPSRFEVPEAMIVGLVPAGLFTLLVIGRLAQRRFFDDDIIDGQAFAPGSGAEIDQRVLTNTIEQIVLALCLWPGIGVILSPGMIVALGVSFAAARTLFWIGYHLSPPLRGLGFAATFYPTVMAAIWAIAKLLK